MARKKAESSADSNEATPPNTIRSVTKASNDYEVGYGKPPKNTRFEKGQSGNPRGRPPKRKPEPIVFSDNKTPQFLREEAYRPVTVIENGKPVEMPVTHAVIRALAVNAMRGSRIAQKNFLEFVLEQEKAYSDAKISNYVRMEIVKRKGEQILEECRRNGTPEPDMLPHPDDIVLNHAKGEAFVNGPETEEGRRVYEHTMKMRDCAIAISVLGERTRKSKKEKLEEGKVCAYMFIAVFVNTSLPKRMRWAEGELKDLLYDYWFMSRKELERYVEEEKARIIETRPPEPYIDPEIKDEMDRIWRKVFKT